MRESDPIGLAAYSHLHAAFGDDSEFRAHQLDAIDSVVGNRGRTLVVQRTGWGKSLVYFIATRLLRDMGAGPTLIISPLLALMRDQMDMAARLGIQAHTINSANRDDWSMIESALESDNVDVLLISPERLNNPTFRDQVLEPLARATDLFVIDEAHCISDWGHDFRPDYRRLVRVLELLPPHVPVLCTTATANDRVISDIQQQLGDDLAVIRGSLDRPSLRLHALTLDTQAQRLAWLATWLHQIPGSGIIYCLTVADTRRVADWLNEQGLSAASYSGDDDLEDRLKVEAALKGNELKVVVATSALGMGYDKADLRYVIHFQSPSSPIAYYQQVGRAGRAVDRAEGVLLCGQEDAEIWQYFLENSFSPQHDAEGIIRVLEDSDSPLSLSGLEGAINIRRSRLTATLKLLEVEGAVSRSGSLWERTVRPWAYDAQRVERVTQQRIAEQAQMREYADTSECRMRFLRETLDDPGAEKCHRCDNCTAPSFVVPLSRDLLAAAAEFLRRRPATIDPRARWPGVPRSGLMPAEVRLQPGRALSTLGDGGWGDVVWECKQRGQMFPDDLIDALARLVLSWQPVPAPEWVAYVPSSDERRQGVPDLARRLAERLSLPLTTAVVKTRATRPQKLMGNSAQKLTNVLDAYTVRQPVPPRPLLLVDDVVGSRWTLTVIGVALREAGSGSVFPLALARTKG